MCSSLPSCAGYGFVSSNGYCTVHGSMTSAPSGWTYMSRTATTITGTSGHPGASCYVKEGILFFIALLEYKPRPKDRTETEAAHSAYPQSAVENQYSNTRPILYERCTLSTIATEEKCQTHMKIEISSQTKHIFLNYQ